MHDGDGDVDSDSEVVISQKRISTTLWTRCHDQFRGWMLFLLWTVWLTARDVLSNEITNIIGKDLAGKEILNMFGMQYKQVIDDILLHQTVKMS